MARQFLKLSSAQAFLVAGLPIGDISYSFQPLPLVGSFYNDDDFQPIGETDNGKASWPVIKLGQYYSTTIEVPDGIRALCLAPHTDIDAVLVKIGTDSWRFLGPGGVIFTMQKETTMQVRPAFPIIEQNAAGGIVSTGYYGDAIVEMFTGDSCPPAGYRPTLLPMRTVVFKDAIAAPNLSVDANGNPNNPVLITSGYNVDRAEFTFRVSGVNNARVALGDCRIDDSFTAGDYIQSDYADVAPGFAGAAMNLNMCNPALVVLVGNAAGGSELAPNAQLTLFRKFIG